LTVEGDYEVFLDEDNKYLNAYHELRGTIGPWLLKV
jgi:hypothetical protein